MVSPETLEGIIVAGFAMGLSLIVVAAIGLMALWFSKHI